MPKLPITTLRTAKDAVISLDAAVRPGVRLLKGRSLKPIELDNRPVGCVDAQVHTTWRFLKQKSKQVACRPPVTTTGRSVNKMQLARHVRVCAIALAVFSFCRTASLSSSFGGASSRWRGRDDLAGRRSFPRHVPFSLQEVGEQPESKLVPSIGTGNNADHADHDGSLHSRAYGAI